MAAKMRGKGKDGVMYELTAVPCRRGGLSCPMCDYPCGEHFPEGDRPFRAYCRTSVGSTKPAKVWKAMDPLHQALLEVKENEDGGRDNKDKQ